ncbi:MAG TPA: class I SAM-dependent methyltransferase [Chitinophagaceae bacterium]|nr:class I SAM-dependent methyltransferase [Chitinophagaceae bacterium]
MSRSITYNKCPVCGSVDIAKVLQAKDYTVSREIFFIWHCSNCTARFTQNAPPPNEIGKYYQSSEYVSHSETKSGFINKAYHTVRNITLQTKKKLVIKTSGKQTASLLDLGAGTGAFASVMQQAGWQVTALEPDATARENALKHHGMQLHEMEILMQLQPKEFDVITLWHVLEHVHLLHEYVEQLYTVLKDDGCLIVAVPNYTSYDATLYKEYWAAYDVPRHLYHFSPLSVQQLMQQHGFAIVQHKPQWFDSFYVSMLSEKYKTGSGNLLRAVWNGVMSNLKAISDYKKCSSVIYVMKKNAG